MANPVPVTPPPDAAGAFDYKAILQQMVHKGASDLHLKVGRPPTLRINGELVPLELPQTRPEQLRSLAEQTMSAKHMQEFTEHHEADFALGVPGIGRFRVNAYHQRGTIAFAFRIIAFQAQTIEELHLPAVCADVAMRPRGLVLVTGITGSGKSTALAAMIHHINTHRRANIITIEDPIEF
ncbi:MAG: ATPase, T2SS/T4P/T4SS family, partial [Gemmatimonadaceae bacterium]